MRIKNETTEQLINDIIETHSYPGILLRPEQMLQKREEEFRLLFENAKDAIFWADPVTGLIIKCNMAAEALLEKTKDEIVGHPQTTLHPPEKTKCYIKMFKKHIEQKGAIDEEAEVITKSGKITPVHITASVTSVDGRPIVQGIFRDISERKETEEKMRLLNKELCKSNRKLQRLALKDPQTGLYNHRYFAEIIESEFYRAKRYAYSLSMMMLDVDYFKSINDAYGHQFGDLVLKQFSKKLRKLVRLHDHVIRFGGEEFIVILPGTDRPNALQLAQRLADSLKLCRFGDGSTTVGLRFSVAVVCYPQDNIFRSTDLIELAEQVLDKVKESGGDKVFSYADIKGKDSWPLDDDEEDTADAKSLKQRLVKLTKKANQSIIESIFAFARAIELKDHYTGNHVERTVYYATEVAKELGLCRSDVMLVRQASMLHDLGKIGISEKILLKKGKLTKKEFEKIKEHPKIGVDVIRPVQFLHCLIPLIFYHHERWDGKGYPCGLKGEI